MSIVTEDNHAVIKMFEKADFIQDDDYRGINKDNDRTILFTKKKPDLSHVIVSWFTRNYRRYGYRY